MRGPALLLMVILAACGQPGADCQLSKVVQLPLEVQNHLLVVPIGINGRWARMIVDSGAERTTLSEAAAARLGLPQDGRFVTHSTGIGGVSAHADVTVANLVLGGVRFPIDRMAVGSLNFDRRSGLVADGLLGADILLAFETDIDVPGGSLTLYRVRRCAGTKPPWSESVAEIMGVTSRKDRMLIPFDLDGVIGQAILDTGAQRTVIGVQMARRMGLTEQTMAGDPVIHHRGAGPATMDAHVHRFQQLRIGPALMARPALSVLPTDAGVGDALVGEDFLEGRRVWLSFPTRQFFVSRLAQEVAAVK